jgi:hypothetical protein
MYVDNVRRIQLVTPDRLVREAMSWGLTRQLARDVIADVLKRAPAAINAAAEETDGLPSDLRSLVESQCGRLTGGLRETGED